MSSARSKLITRRGFVALLGGLAGFGAVSWSFTRGSGPTSATIPATVALSELPAVTAPAPVTVAAAVADESAVAVAAAAPSRIADVLCRDAWGAQPVVGELTPHVLERLTVHHTAAVLSSDAAAPTYMRDHQSFHQVDNGWPDLAYHFVIDAAGVIYEGRPVGAVGDTATDYDPAGHFLVACEGDFERHEVPEPQREALIDLLAWAAGTHAIDPGTVRGHRDWAATTCPGIAMYALVTDGTLEAAIRSRLGEGGVGIDLRCGPEADRTIAAIEAGFGGPGAPPSRPTSGIE